MAKTRRATMQVVFQPGHLMKLPPELLRMIFEYFNPVVDNTWLAQMAAVCKAFQVDAEAILYSYVWMHTCKKVLSFCRAIGKRPSRGIAVRELILWAKSGKTIGKPLKRTLQLLTNLRSVCFLVDDPAIYELLIDVPFRLRRFRACGKVYPSCLEDVFYSHPSLVAFQHAFREQSILSTRRPISRQDILPNLRSLFIDVTFYPLSFIQHPYPSITRLFLERARHEDIARALLLFGANLVSFKVLRTIDDLCTPSCYWPTSVIGNARLPRLRHLEVMDDYDPYTELPGELSEASAASVHGACPELRKFIWSTDSMTLGELDVVLDQERKWTVMKGYVRLLCRYFPKMQRVCITQMYDRQHCGPHGEPCGAIFMRVMKAGKAVVRGPFYGVAAVTDEWEKVPDDTSPRALTSHGLW